MSTINIDLSAERIKAVAGEKVRIKATFDQMAYASVNERREVNGYQNVIRTSGKVALIDIEAEVHEDTTDFIVLADTQGVPHLNERQNAVEAWYHVEVTGQPKPEPADIGKYLYKVGLLSDYHLFKDNNGAEAKDNWWDEDDFRAAMDIFKADTEVKFVAGCGDVAESGSPKKGTPEDDYAEFLDIYDVPYWQVAGLRFFTPMGNHDFYGLFESRQGDTITGQKNTETVAGYNANVNLRLANWVMNQMVSYVVPTGRITFDLEAGKHTLQGQADMNFFAFNGYVDLYAQKAGYKGASIWDSAKGGISDMAILMTKDYVNSHWHECKDRLTGWCDSGLHGRNGYSKLSYYLKRDDEIYIFLSVDYGNDVWPLNDQWHDRMIHARTIIDLNCDDPFIRRMEEFVADTGYSQYDRPYDYQYYSVNALIWLKEIIENNTDKKIFVFTHHFLPHKVGNSNGIPQNGAYSYAEVSADGELTAEGINRGSNALTGIEFHFLNKLNNLYKNVVWFSGHSHISWEVGCNIDHHDYAYIMPNTGGKNVYTKADANPVSEAAWSVSMPSLSKPRNIAGNESQRMYDDAEIAVMEVYERGVKIKGYKVRKNNVYVYNQDKPLVEQVIQMK